MDMLLVMPSILGMIRGIGVNPNIKQLLHHLMRWDLMLWLLVGGLRLWLIVVEGKGGSRFLGNMILRLNIVMDLDRDMGMGTGIIKDMQGLSDEGHRERGRDWEVRGGSCMNA
jgi:hypothetical protein